MSKLLKQYKIMRILNISKFKNAKLIIHAPERLQHFFNHPSLNVKTLTDQHQLVSSIKLFHY